MSIFSCSEAKPSSTRVILLVGLTLMPSCSRCGETRPDEPPTETAISSSDPTFLQLPFEETFSTEPGADHWIRLLSGSPRIAVLEKSVSPSGKSRLRLGLDTLKTESKSLYLVGLRSARPLDLTQPSVIRFVLDWNHQSNGCYLSAGLILAPEAMEGNPEEGRDWLKVEYVGVPPGINGRRLLAMRKMGGLQLLESDGWPEGNREGRPLGVQQMEITILPGYLKVTENGKVVYNNVQALPFDKAFLYFRLQSHSNYPFREVFLGDLSISPVELPGTDQRRP